MLKDIPSEFLQKNLILPLESNGDTKLGICPETPTEALEDLRLVLGKDLEITRMEKEEVEEGLRNLLVAEISAQAEDESELDLSAETLTQDLLTLSKEAPIIRLVNSLFLKALHSRASDIHIEPYENECPVRIRIDGVLHSILNMPKSQYNTVAARIKVMSRLNLAEHRLPQDGRIRIKAGNRVLDVRVSVIPTLFGERIVMRLLDQTMELLTLPSLGLAPEDFGRIKELISNPYGSILVTGPTGSGKSTTLYAILLEVMSPARNIITIEDPVEYQIKGIGQMQVNPKIKLTFAQGLRSILRQDPDVIMVGEIRDPETADIATHSALTGHLLLSTLHTNDAPGAIARMVDMGVEAYLLSSSLLGIVAQRLVRKLCPDCKTPYQPGNSELRALGKNPPDKIYRPKGCDNCLGTGFKGRNAIFEILTLDEDLRSQIIRSPEANSIRKLARENGMKTLLEDGMDKVTKGITSIEEVLSATRV